MKGWFAGTRARLTLVHAIVLATAILIADIVLYAALAGVEGSAADDVLRSQASTIAAGIEDINGQVRFGGGDLPTESQQGVAVDAAIVAADGSIVQTPAQPLSVSTLAEVAARARASASPILISVRDSRGAPRHVYAERLDTGQGGSAVLIVSRSVGELQAGLGRTVLFLGVVSALLVVAGAFLAHWLTGRVLLPVRRITSMARSLSEHDLHKRVDLAVPPDELGELVETFNGMLARLEASFDSLRRFTADASHELRSPLTLMRSELEGTLARARTPAEYRVVLSGLEEEVERMARMVDQLLILARADAGALQPEIMQLDVADFLHESAARWRPIAERRDVHVEVEAPDSGAAWADPSLLRRVVDNLLDNAIRHTPADAAVHLAGSREPGGWRIDVRDEGAGIPQADQKALFARFARLDSSRGRESGGAGLGLALSRAIAESHGGTLELVKSDPTGATFRLILPDREDHPFNKPLADDARMGDVPRISAGRP
jgi:heavy metal sensor kinase